jgi:hypothetical protein
MAVAVSAKTSALAKIMHASSNWRYAISIVLLIYAAGAGESSMAIERAQYSVVTNSPPYEVRDYQSSIVAIVDVDGSRSDAVNSGFRLLANYIFGGNEEKSKIAMTAPVTQMPQRADPGTASNQDASPRAAWVVRFMMPAGFTLNSLPTPVDTRVHFQKIPAHRVAAISFSGFWSDANLASHETQLRDWMRTQHLTPASPAAYAYYDPPWTPWFMRTIEVLIDIA